MFSFKPPGSQHIYMAGSAPIFASGHVIQLAREICVFQTGYGCIGNDLPKKRQEGILLTTGGSDFFL